MHGGALSAGAAGGPNLWCRLARGSRSKYLGLSALLAWHYCLWFQPSAFPRTFLLDDVITFGWLSALGSASLTAMALGLVLGRRRHLPESPWLGRAAAGTGAACTAAMTLWGANAGTVGLALALSGGIGAAGAVLWVAWGECLARQRARFTMSRVGTTYGCFLLASLAITGFLPGVAAPCFVAALPLVSGWLLDRHLRTLSGIPHLVMLPRKLSWQGTRAIVTVALISFAASFVCYYTVAIVPWAHLGEVGPAFAWGAALGAAMMLAAAAAKLAPLANYSVFRLFPWLVMLTVVACTLFLSDAVPHVFAFLLALGISSMFEVLLTMYMGGLTLRGYTSAALAFALAACSIRAGIALGNGLALVYERVPGWHEALVAPTFLVMIGGLTGVLITLVRQEYAIDALVSDLGRTTDLEAVLAAVAAEFKLSEREREVANLIGRGYTAAAVAETLVISQYTVNTHVQHIYGKMGIHKRAELIRYLHRRC
ncbi:MAG: helix-turn-helix transcriptional regulator [Bifidobacteriaceae bacterium]|nr:helix-turn-helix transcriptional regulator [Bifidobacteriaceae bacterium]